jgi:nitrite reductase/ring-hydroxylating ferredoxin subunit
MNPRALRRYIDDLLRGHRPKAFRPNEFEAAQIRTAIDLQAARMGADAPRQEFLTDLQRRIGAQIDDGPAPNVVTMPSSGANATRRQVIVGTTAAATAAVAAVSADRLLIGRSAPADTNSVAMTPAQGSWQRVAASGDLPEGATHPFDLGSVVGFVRRVDGRAEAVSGVCTHQGCRLWLDAADDRLRCPCHSTSFSTAGQVVTHALPIAPKPLPKLDVREINGTIEVLAPIQPTQRL